MGRRNGGISKASITGLGTPIGAGPKGAMVIPGLVAAGDPSGFLRTGRSILVRSPFARSRAPFPCFACLPNRPGRPGSLDPGFLEPTLGVLGRRPPSVIPPPPCWTALPPKLPTGLGTGSPAGAPGGAPQAPPVAATER